jgi:hypothetical protein
MLGRLFGYDEIFTSYFYWSHFRPTSCAVGLMAKGTTSNLLSATIFLTTDQRESHSLNYTNVYFLRKCLKHKLDMQERFEVSNFVGSVCKGETDLVFNLVLYFEECSQGLTRSYCKLRVHLWGNFPF